MPDAAAHHAGVMRARRLLGGAYAVIERDFLVTTSTRRFLAARVVVTLLAVILVAATAIANRRSPPDEIGRTVLMSVTVALPILTLVLATALAAPAIVTEREGGTLDLVLVAPVRPLSLIASKFVARFLCIGVLVVAVLPVASVALVYGGVSLELFLHVTLFSLTVAALGTAAGLLASSRTRTVSAALLLAFVIALVVPHLPILVAWAATWRDLGALADWWEKLLPTQPVGVWFEMCEAAYTGGLDADLVPRFGVYTLAVCVAAVLCAAALLQQSLRVTPRAQRPRRARALFLANPLIDRAVRGTLLWHPTATGLLVPLLALAVEVFFIWGGYEWDNLDESGWHVAMLGLLTLLATFQVLATTSGSIASERRRGSLDVLLATPVTRGNLAFCTAAGALIAASPLLVLGLAHGAVVGFAGWLRLPATIAWAAASTSVVSFAAALGTWTSASAPSPTQAALRAFGIYFGGFLLISLAAWVAALSGMDDDFLGPLFASLPHVLPWYQPAAVHSVFRRHGFSRFPETHEYVISVLAVIAWLVVARLLVRRAAAALERFRE